MMMLIIGNIDSLKQKPDVILDKEFILLDLYYKFFNPASEYYHNPSDPVSFKVLYFQAISLWWG